MPSSSTSSLPLAFRLSNQSPTRSRRQNGHGNGSRTQPQQQKKKPKHREEAEELELKKRKMRQMVAIYSKQKSAADLKPPKAEATGGRKKCKNPNCRCRERRKRKEKHQEERQPENGATTTENVPKRAAEEVQQEVKMGAEKEKAAGKDVEMPMAKENGGGGIGTGNNGFDGQNQVQQSAEGTDETNIGYQQQWQNNGHLGEQQGQQQQQQQWNTVDERAARMALTFSFHDIRAQMLADCFRCLNSVSSSFSQHLLLSAQREHYEIEKRLPKLMARFSQGQLDILCEKRKQLEKSYKLNCVTTGLVSRKLLLKDPALEEQLKQPLLAVMADFEADTWAEMDQFIEGLLL